MELGQISTDISVLRARWAVDRSSRFLAWGLGSSLSSARVRFLWKSSSPPTLVWPNHTQSSVKESGGPFSSLPASHRVNTEGKETR